MHATVIDPATSARPEDLAEELMVLMTYIHRASGNGFYELVEERDLSMTQVKALHVLDRADHDVSVKELADLLGISLPAASRTVEGLLQRGHLERREDEEDRRVKRVRLSTSGSELAVALIRERLAGLQEFAASLSERQRRRLSGALASLLERDDIAACRALSTPGRPGTASRA